MAHESAAVVLCLKRHRRRDRLESQPTDRLGEPRIKLGTPGYKPSGLSTTPRRLLVLQQTHHIVTHTGPHKVSISLPSFFQYQ